jgi:hypothetical protein
MIHNWESVVPFLTKARDFSLFYNIQTCSEAHPISYAMGTGGSFLGDKVTERRS